MSQHRNKRRGRFIELGPPRSPAVPSSELFPIPAPHRGYGCVSAGLRAATSPLRGCRLGRDSGTRPRSERSSQPAAPLPAPARRPLPPFVPGAAPALRAATRPQIGAVRGPAARPNFLALTSPGRPNREGAARLSAGLRPTLGRRSIPAARPPAEHRLPLPPSHRCAATARLLRYFCAVITPTKRKLCAGGPGRRGCGRRGAAAAAAAAGGGRHPDGRLRRGRAAAASSEARGRTSREASTKPSTSPSSTLSQARRPRPAIARRPPARQAQAPRCASSQRRRRRPALRRRRRRQPRRAAQRRHGGKGKGREAKGRGRPPPGPAPRHRRRVRPRAARCPAPLAPPGEGRWGRG